MVLSPYDAELFGHWWYEGPEFLDYFIRKTIYDQQVIELTTPWEYLRKNPTQQVAAPSASSWGDEGYWKVWLNEKNEWIYPHQQIAQERMTELVKKFPKPDAVTARALKQAGRELLLRADVNEHDLPPPQPIEQLLAADLFDLAAEIAPGCALHPGEL